MRHLWKRILLLLGISLAIALGGFIAWASFPLGPGEAALAALQTDETVLVEKVQDWTVFRPNGIEPQTGFIFYPGGRVDYRSYAPLLKPLAREGYLVVLVPMPLSLAVFAPDKAEEVIAAYPGIEYWAIGGHSLGGAMAARYAFTHPGKVAGLALWASYPADTDSLADRELTVVSIAGTKDGVSRKQLEESAALLPADTQWVKIEGGNHSQFGDYGLQPGDGTAEITPQEQWKQVVSATLDLLKKIEK